MPNAIADNIQLVIGFVRALFLFLVAFGYSITAAQQSATIGLLVAAIPLISLGFTIWTWRTTVPKVPSATALPASIQQPPAP